MFWLWQLLATRVEGVPICCILADQVYAKEVAAQFQQVSSTPEGPVRAQIEVWGQDFPHEAEELQDEPATFQVSTLRTIYSVLRLSCCSLEQSCRAGED